MSWEAAEFEVAEFTGPRTVAGYIYNELGIYRVPSHGERLPRWALVHLGSGLNIAFINDKVAAAFPIATEVADAGDWGFLTIEGAKDRFPEYHERVWEIGTRHQALCPTFGELGDKGREIARAIAYNRP